MFYQTLFSQNPIKIHELLDDFDHVIWKCYFVITFEKKKTIRRKFEVLMILRKMK
jgi:hypothetical protein